MSLLVILGIGQSGFFTSETSQLYVLQWDYESNTTDEIEIRSPEVPKRSSKISCQANLINRETVKVLE
jgi:hypothetical protein